MKTKIIVTNRNRDGAKIWLERVKRTNEYILHTDKEFVLQYSRIIFDTLPDDTEVYDWELKYTNQDPPKLVKIKCKAFDPSGGPYISVGEEIIKNHIIQRIYNDSETNNTMFTIIENKNNIRSGSPCDTRCTESEK